MAFPPRQGAKDVAPASGQVIAYAAGTAALLFFMVVFLAHLVEMKQNRDLAVYLQEERELPGGFRVRREAVTVWGPGGRPAAVRCPLCEGAGQVSGDQMLTASTVMHETGRWSLVDGGLSSPYHIFNMIQLSSDTYVCPGCRGRRVIWMREGIAPIRLVGDDQMHSYSLPDYRRGRFESYLRLVEPF
jgi:hypothetical protein